PHRHRPLHDIPSTLRHPPRRPHPLPRDYYVGLPPPHPRAHERRAKLRSLPHPERGFVHLETLDPESVLHRGDVGVRQGAAGIRASRSPVERGHVRPFPGGDSLRPPSTNLFVDITKTLVYIPSYKRPTTMMDRLPPRPTDAELSILRVL